MNTSAHLIIIQRYFQVYDGTYDDDEVFVYKENDLHLNVYPDRLVCLINMAGIQGVSEYFRRVYKNVKKFLFHIGI